MTTKERLHKLVDGLPEAKEAEAAEALAELQADVGEGNGAEPRRTVDDWDKQWGEPETAWMPESWKTFEDGTPQPDWLATLDEVRRGR
jgi:hypothetical protein